MDEPSTDPADTGPKQTAEETIMSITIQTEGRRTYLSGNTYPHRDAIRNIGAHWDAARKMWWTAKHEAAEQLVARLNQAQPAQSGDSKAPRDGLDSIVAGRAEYKGRTYYLAGRLGNTRYDDCVGAVQTRDGAKYLLYFRDGSSQFWAARDQVRVLKSYDRPQTIRGLREYAERAKQGGDKLESGYYYGRGGEVLASGCSECSRLGRMCSSCEHDYY